MVVICLVEAIDRLGGIDLQKGWHQLSIADVKYTYLKECFLKVSSIS